MTEKNRIEEIGFLSIFKSVAVKRNQFNETDRIESKRSFQLQPINKH